MQMRFGVTLGLGAWGLWRDGCALRFALISLPALIMGQIIQNRM
jgi:hypothetical protein